MENKIKVGIVGGAGYTGGELIRLLLNHPHVQIVFVNSNSNAGKPLYAVHQDLLGDTNIIFTAEVNQKIDLLFMCLGHGDSKMFLATNTIDENTKVIDLSQDFRLSNHSSFNDRVFVYGLPELNKEQIAQANNIANPGCFATALQLGLLPLAKVGLLTEVYSTGITGSTGAGQGLSPTSHFSWRANNVQAYKTLEHQHLFEIVQSLHQLEPSRDININFVPWRGDFTRGIFISSQLKCGESLDQLYRLFTEYFTPHPFTTVSNGPINLKQIVNTNKCVIHLEKVGENLVVHSAIDNLLKGASGQAIQNMNIMFGLEEAAGLKLKAVGF